MLKKTLTMMSDFLKNETAGGLVLMIAALAAIAISNSPLSDSYFHLLHIKLGDLSLQHWINDALMAIFFMLVGLEIKREMITGELGDWPRRLLPGLAALGGVICPAVLFVIFNWSSPNTIKGWAIPTATDIAFALGVLALLGNRIPTVLKVLLTALAIIDDLVAVIIIAIFYTEELSLAMLGMAFIGILALFVLNRLKVKPLWPYLILGVFIWYFVFKSGVHATLAGVAVSLFIPLQTHSKDGDDHHSPLIRLEHALHKPVAFVIVPLFGFANAGVALIGLEPEIILGSIPMGVAIGLFLGKQLGVFTAIFLAIKTGLAKMPTGVSWWQLYGLSVLCGIGFTMSLFIGMLAFPNHPLEQDAVKIGVLLGSICSALAGYLLLSRTKYKPR